jgi:MFS family permease
MPPAEATPYPATSPKAAAAPSGPSARSQRGLDWVNFFIADVQTAFGPFIAVQLLLHGWKSEMIGTVLTVNSAVGILSQTPAGMLVDQTHAKRAVVAACLALTAGGALIFAFFPSYVPVMMAQVMHGAAGGVVQTALAAIGLGLVGHRMFHHRVGRNERFNTLGNAATALAMGGLGTLISPAAPFLVAAGLCVPAGLALLAIRPQEIDYRKARGAERRKEPKAARFRELGRNRRLLAFALCLVLFQFADASILPLASERLAMHDRSESVLLSSVLIAIPQFVTALIAGWVSRHAESWGRKPLLLVGFVALAVRGALFGFIAQPAALAAAQLLAGASTVVVGIMTPLVVADITQGSARYNASLGSVQMLSLIGAAASTTVSGFAVERVGFAATFLGLAAVGLLGLAAVWLLLPETAQEALRKD